jgi:soluble lytic murein transglycosylase-like protein
MAISNKVLQWQHVVEMWARLTGVPTWLLYATIQQESGGNANATRFEPKYLKTYGNTTKFLQIQKKTLLKPEEIATSYGLMQLMLPLAWGYMSASDKPDPIAALCDPDKNIRYGAAHLAALIKGRPITPAVIRDVAGKYNGAGSDSAYARNVCALWRKYEEAIQ